MSFDFKSLSSTPLSPKERIESNNVLKPSNGGFDFNALPKTPIELAAQHIYQYGSYTPESFGLGVRQKQQLTTQWGIGVTPQSGVSMKTAQTTPKIGDEVPPPKSYFEGLADTIDAITEQGQKASEQYKRGEINAATKYSGDVANITSLAVAPIGEFINQIPVVSGIMKVMSEGLQFGPKGAGEALSNVPGYKQILEKNPWISEYSEAITPTVENATVTAMNLGMLVGTIESTARIVRGGNEALQYRVRKDADGNLVTRNPDGDVIYIEDKTGQTKYGDKPANYPLIRINSAVQDIRESAPLAVENGKVTKNAGTIKEIITGTKSGQNWWAQNAEADAASQRVAAKVDLSTSIDTTGTVNTKPQQEYFRQTYLDKTESVGYDLLAKEDASVNLERVINKLKEEFGNTNLPQSIVEKAVNATVKKLLTTADELGNIKLLELAREKSAAQRSANYERTQNNTNNEIKNKTVGRALRLVVEETSKTDVAKVNGELSKLYQELAVLERLDTMKVSGGKLSKYFAQISGNIIGGLAGGAIGGPVGAAGAAVVGGELSSALRGRIMAGKFKKTTPSGETSATLKTAIAETKTKKKVDLKTPDKKVGAPKTVKKTPEIVKLEAQIAKNVEAQKAAIKAKDYTLVAKLKEAYDILVTQLKKAIKYLNENGSVGMSIKKSVTPESVAKRADDADMGVLDYVIRDYDNAVLDPNVNRTLSDMGLGKATRDERIRFAKDVFDEQAGVGGKVTIKKDVSDPKNFKSAEEFVNAQGQVLYHGGAKIDEVGSMRSRWKAFYMSDDPTYAKSYGGSKSVLNEIVLSPDAKLADLRKPTDELISQLDQMTRGRTTGKTFNIQKPDGTYIGVPEVLDAPNFGSYTQEQVIEGIKQGKAHFAEEPAIKEALKKLGYDGMITQESKYGANYGVWNKNVLKTRSQLTDIWKKANRKVSGDGK